MQKLWASPGRWCKAFREDSLSPQAVAYRDFPSLGLGFLFCKKGIITTPPTRGGVRDFLTDPCKAAGTELGHSQGLEPL